MTCQNRGAEAGAEVWIAGWSTGTSLKGIELALVN
jgi:hypothetical protein